MAYTLTWYVPNRVVYGVLEDPFALSDLGVIQTEMAAFYEEGTAPVHLIVDARPIKRPIFNIREIRTAGLRPRNNPKLGQVIVIQNNILLRQFATLLIHVFNLKVQLILVLTLEDAIHTLRVKDLTLEGVEIPSTPPTPIPSTPPISQPEN